MSNKNHLQNNKRAKTKIVKTNNKIKKKTTNLMSETKINLFENYE